jgi:hypothetical protein
MVGSERHELIASAVEERIRTDQERAESLLEKGRKDRLNVVFRAGI